MSEFLNAKSIRGILKKRIDNIPYSKGKVDNPEETVMAQEPIPELPAISPKPCSDEEEVQKVKDLLHEMIERCFLLHGFVGLVKVYNLLDKNLKLLWLGDESPLGDTLESKETNRISKEVVTGESTRPHRSSRKNRVAVKPALREKSKSGGRAWEPEKTSISEEDTSSQSNINEDLLEKILGEIIPEGESYEYNEESTSVQKTYAPEEPMKENSGSIMTELMEGYVPEEDVTNPFTVVEEACREDLEFREVHNEE